MTTRYSRQIADGTFEHHETKETLREAKRAERSAGRAAIFGLFGLLFGCLITFVVVHASGVDFPKWLRLLLVLAGGVGLAYILGRFADLIWNIILTIIGLTAIFWIGSLIWKVI